MQQNSYSNYLVSQAPNYAAPCAPLNLNPNFAQPIQPVPPQAMMAPQPVAQPMMPIPNSNPNAVNINIVAPQAYASSPLASQIGPNNFYPIYGQNVQPAMPYYPANYNNMIQQNPQPQQQMDTSKTNAYSETNLFSKKGVEDKEPAKKPEEKEQPKKTKKVIPLTNEYVQSLEGYLDDNNPKVRLIGAKELMERFKEDDNRKDNPSLIPLLNKTLRDNNAAVRFLALTSLQLGYCVGNDETVQILKEIQASTENKMSEDSILASEVLLKMCAGESQEIVDKSAKKDKEGDK